MTFGLNQLPLSMFRHVTAEANILGMQDAFLVTAVLAVLVFIMTLFLNKKKVTKMLFTKKRRFVYNKN
ncbi:hypothetical protein [Bacillus sp. NPDC094077]|uniref:hypothetical protein n=1 Tax=Bacillus sp. NPDC094077 TaxID=3390932 RepID=UPI003CFCDBE2